MDVLPGELQMPLCFQKASLTITTISPVNQGIPCTKIGICERTSKKEDPNPALAHAKTALVMISSRHFTKHLSIPK